VPQDRARFVRNLENVLESFTYWVQLNDGTSESYRVTVEPQPVLSALKCVQVYPAYTGLAPQPRALGDLALLAGSTLQLDGIASKPLQRAAARLVGPGHERPLAVDPQNPRLVRGEFTIPTGGLTGFAVPLLDQRGLRSRDEVVYRIDIVPDRAPTLSLTYPIRKEELVTAAGILLVAFEASDDFGIQAVALHYKAGESGQVQTIELDLEGRTPKTIRRRYEWRFATLQPPPVEGTTVEYWVEARDNNNVTGPGVTVTDHYFVKVVSEAEKRADLFSRFDENLSLLGNIAENQEKLNAALGDLIRGRPAARTP
jgi:hypothetical protein